MFIRVGLGLGSAIAIFASISSDVIAMEDKIHKDDIYKERSQLNQIWWRVEVSNRIKDTKLNKEYAWIKNGYYWDSIVKVIGKAIGDCVTGENEFEEQEFRDVITFDKTNPEKYDRANWSALVLYNYLTYKKRQIYESHEIWTTDDVENKTTFASDIGEVREDVIKYCRCYCNMRGLTNSLERFTELIEPSCNDICCYNDALGLQEKINNLLVTAKLYDAWGTKSIKKARKKAKRMSECVSYFNAMRQAKKFVREIIDLLEKIDVTDDISRLISESLENENIVKYPELTKAFEKCYQKVCDNEPNLHNQLCSSCKNFDKGQFDTDLKDIEYYIREFCHNRHLELTIGYHAYQTESDLENAKRYSVIRDKEKELGVLKELRMVPDSRISEISTVNMNDIHGNRNLLIDLSFDKRNRIHNFSTSEYLIDLDALELEGAVEKKSKFTLSFYYKTCVDVSPDEKIYLNKLLEGPVCTG